MSSIGAVKALAVALNKPIYAVNHLVGHVGADVLGPEGPFDMPPTFETLSDRGLVIHGSPDTVKRKLEKLFKELPVDYFWMFIYNHMPHAQGMKSLELLTEKVWPEFTDTIGNGARPAKR